MTAPTQLDAQQQHPSACLNNRGGDYLVVDELNAAIQSPRDERTFSNASIIQFNKLDSIKKSDFKVVQSSSSLAAKLSSSSSASGPGVFVIESAVHGYKPVHTQYYSPINNSFVELPDPVQEELNENDQVDEYIQVELGEKKPAANRAKPEAAQSRLEAISSEPSSEASGCKETAADGHSADENAEEEKDYIGIESFSNTATNPEASENFEVSNLSPISSTSCNTSNILSRVKTFSTSSNTSNNELNSLGTSPSLNSNSFYSQTPVNHAKEEVYKLESVKSYFQTPEDDYIRPARAYSIGTRFERPKLSNVSKMKHCPAMTKSKSNTINGPTQSNTSLILNDASGKHFSSTNRKGKATRILVRVASVLRE